MDEAGAARRVGRPRRRWLLAPIVSFCLVGLAWLLTTPPGAGLDEVSHYVRTIGIAHGQLHGDPVPADTPFPLTGPSLHRVLDEAGSFRLPGDLPPPNNCNVLVDTEPFDCAQRTPTSGTITEVSFHAAGLPLSYLVPAVLSRGGTTTWRALLLARLGFLIEDAALFGVVVVALSRLLDTSDRVRLAMLVLCATPLLAFQIATLTPNAPEILGALAFLASFLAALRLRSTRWSVAAATVAVVACWSRDLGVAEVAIFAVLAVRIEPDGARWAWGRRRAPSIVAAAATLLVGVLGSLIWQAHYKSSLRPRLESPSRYWADLGGVVTTLRNSIGLVGWLNVRIDPLIDALWIVAWLLGFAWLVQRATSRTRRIIVAIGVTYVVVDLALISAVRAAGFATQARYTMALPIGAVIALAVSRDRVVRDEQPRRRDRAVLLGAGVICALGNFSALLISAKRNANGLDGSPTDFAHPAWSPTGGWTPAIALMIAASATIVAAPLLGVIPRPGAEP